MSNSTRTQATISDVRAFAQAQGIPFAAKGRPSLALVEAFNKGKRGAARYAAGQGEQVVIEAKPAKGRKVVRVATVQEVRAAALAAGEKVGERGRIPADVLTRFALGTLGQSEQSEPVEAPAPVEA